MIYAIAVYLLIAVGVYAWELAWWEGRFPEIADSVKRENLFFSTKYGLVWPLALPASIWAMRDFNEPLWRGLKFIPGGRVFFKRHP
jgi:hypothetical protein